MITYQEDNIATVLERHDILLAHFYEVEKDEIHMEVDIDYDTYYTLEDSGVLKTFTVKDDGVLIGYYTVVLYPNLHYKGRLYGVADMMYLIEGYRGRGIGSKFIYFVNAHLENRGVEKTVINSKPGSPLDKLLVKEGYNHIENMYDKYIGSMT